MSNQSCIFWFSGTGNSLYAAKQLSAQLDNIPLVQITDQEPSGTVGGAGVKVGFVFPSFYENLPRAVRAFVEKLDIQPDTYIFCIVTMGGIGIGSVAALESALKAKRLRLSYGRGLKMPDNYVLLYNPSDTSQSEKRLDKADELIRIFSTEIAAQKRIIKKIPLVMNTLYKNIESLDAKFTVSSNCTACGLCEKICPVGNIRLDNGNPKWLHRCEHCVACISWCPARAIEYGNRTQSRRRYRNPRIKADELMRGME